MNQKVSIVIPIYNVELYLPKCIESVLQQHYSNLEVILVNDGSTDHCLDICQHYARLDHRIRVINKENGGLSSARNAGIEHASGEYLMFVDSDDWIHPEMVFSMMEDMQINHVKMVICNMIKCSSDHDFLPLSEKPTQVLPMLEVIRRMLLGEWVSAWAKLYHSSLFQSIRFPLGKTNEDYPILIPLFEHCGQIALNPNVFYYYFTRPGSICTSTLNIRKFDEIDNGKAVYDYVCKKYPQLHNIAQFNWVASLIKLNGAIHQAPEFRFKRSEIVRTVRSNFFPFMRNPVIDWRYKPFLISMMLGRWVDSKFCKLYHWYCMSKRK